MPEPFRIIASVYRSLIEILQEAGLDAGAIADQVGADVTRLCASQEMLNLEQVTTLWALGYQQHGATIGLEVASRVRLVDYQDVGVYLTATEDVADVLHQLEHYCALFSNVVAMQAKDCDEGIEVSLHYQAHVPLIHERLEFLLLSGPILISQYLGSPLQLSCVELTRPAPADSTPWDEAFGVTVQWGAQLTRYVVDHEQAKRRVLTRNELLRRELQLLLDRRLRQDKAEFPLDDIRAVMSEQLAQQVPHVDSVAQALNISVRTLQRRLGNADTSFSEQLSQLRQELAESYLKQGIAVADIAERLGYSDLPSFNRAFKRWLGQTPARYQQTLPAMD